MQFARSDAGRDGTDRTVPRSASATTGANVTLKLDSVSVPKALLVTGVYVQELHGVVLSIHSFFLHRMRRSKTKQLQP